MHGGNAGRPPIHGLYAVKHQQALGEKLEAYLSAPNPESLISELALLRALLQDLLDKITDGTRINDDTRGGIVKLTDAISRLVEREARVRNSTALTAAEVSLLLTAMRVNIEKYIHDPDDRTAFVADIRRTIGIPESLGSGDSD